MAADRLPSLDLLRGGAAFAVAIPHILLFAWPESIALEAAASLGVEVFFVLSGFVLAPQILQCFARPSDFGIFLQRRWMRTIPPYILALVCVSLAAGQFGSNDFIRYAFYLQNFFEQANSLDYFSIAWSLSVEEWFYVIFPLVLIGARSLLDGDRRRAAQVALVFILIVSVGRTMLGNYDAWGEDVRRVVLFRVDAIAYGFLLYLLPHRLGRGLAMLLTALATAASLGALQAIIAADSILGKALFPFAAAAFGASTICLAMSFDRAIEPRQWLTQASTWLGRISFSVYLFHQIIAMLVDRLLLRYSVKITLCLVAITAFSVLFYWFFEKPILDARPKYRQRQQNSALLSAALPDVSVAATETKLS